MLCPDQSCPDHLLVRDVTQLFGAAVVVLGREGAWQVPSCLFSLSALRGIRVTVGP